MKKTETETKWQVLQEDVKREVENHKREVAAARLQLACWRLLAMEVAASATASVKREPLRVAPARQGRK